MNGKLSGQTFTFKEQFGECGDKHDIWGSAFALKK